MHISRRTATLLFLSLSATAWPPVCEKPALPLPKHTSPSRYVSPASSDSLASGHLCTQAPASSTSGLWAPAPASSDSLASGHLCTQAPASSTSGLWAPAPASSDSLASGHLHMHYICVHTQLLAQTRVRTRGDLVSMYLSRGPCFSRKGCLPRSCAHALLTQTQARPAIHTCELPLSSQVFPLCFFFSLSATAWPPVCEKTDRHKLESDSRFSSATLKITRF